MNQRIIEITAQSYKTKGSFRIAHGSVSHIDVVQLSIRQNGYCGRAECRPYARYNETIASVCEQIKSVASQIEKGAGNKQLQELLPAGAARNAIDCALWDLKAKISGQPIYELLNLPKPKPRISAFTLSIDTPGNMAKAAKAAGKYPLLKLKIGGSEGLKACLAVLAARPDAGLIIDANEALSRSDLPEFLAALKGKNIKMIEQPLPASHIGKYCLPESDLVICADEALHTRADLAALKQAGYKAVNVKLDKTGGISEALALMHEARQMGFEIMAGCMVGTSLAMAPMMILSSLADIIDLDGPLLLENDIENGALYKGAEIFPPERQLWG